MSNSNFDNAANIITAVAQAEMSIDDALCEISPLLKED